MMIKHVLAGLAAAAFFSSAAMAQVTVGTPTPGVGNCYPFSCNDSGTSSGQSIDYYQIYSSSAFSGPITFDTVSFSDAGFGGSGDLIGGTYDILFSTTTDPLGSSFPISPLSNTATFLNATLFGSASTGGLTLTGTPYIYNPSDGNLVMEVIVTNQDVVPNGSGNSYLAPDLSGGDATRAYIVTGDVAKNDTTALVTTFSVSGVPEPATWALMLLGLLGIGYAVRRSRSGEFARA
jgi:hypothetical protein